MKLQDEEQLHFESKEYKWYVHRSLDKMCRNKKPNLPALNAKCFRVLKNDKQFMLVLVGKDKEILHEDTTLDGMHCFIRIRREFLKRCK